MNIRFVLLAITIAFIATVIISSLRHRRKIKFQRQFMVDDQPDSTTHSVRETNTRPEIIVDESVKVEKPVVAFFLMARQKQLFDAVELVQKVLMLGLEYTEKGNFVYKAANGEELFQAFSAQEPGFINFAALEGVRLPGLCFVLNNEQSDLTNGFNMMIKLTNELADLVGGLILDINKQPCEEGYLEECRFNLLEYGRRRSEALVTF